MDISFFWKDRSSRLLVTANLIPLIGVMFFHWDVYSILLSYWIESGVIGFYNILKMIKAEGKIYSINNTIVTSNDPRAQLISPDSFRRLRYFLIPFFIVHYSLFMMGHLFFILKILPDFITPSLVATTIFKHSWQPMLIAIISLGLSHGISYYDNYLGKQEYKTVNIALQMFAPYKRILVMHLTVMLSAILLIATRYTPIALIVLIFIKIIIDHAMHTKTHGSIQKVFSGVDT